MSPDTVVGIDPTLDEQPVLVLARRGRDGQWYISAAGQPDPDPDALAAQIAHWIRQYGGERLELTAEQRGCIERIYRHVARPGLGVSLSGDQVAAALAAQVPG